MMTNEALFDVWLSWWPAVVLAALTATFLLPERWYRKDSSARMFTALALWLVSAFWLLPVYIFTAEPATLDAPNFTPALTAKLLDELHYITAAPLYLVLYAGLGLVWAIVHFWLYARRLGQRYVMERDAWLKQEGLESLDGLTREQRKRFNAVIDIVKYAMLYRGDFPLRPLQQKRFFVSNLLLWPATLAGYFVGNFVCDVARSLWFALRGWIHSKWVVGMTQYLEDEANCRAYIAQLEDAKLDAPGAARGRSMRPRVKIITSE